MGCNDYADSKLVRLRKNTYETLEEFKKDKESFDKIITKMILIYRNRIVTESELRYEVKKELIEILLRYLEKEM